MPFRIALSGLDAASTDLEVTGHNVANAATNGFKQSRAEFADLYATSIQDVSATAAGRGVKVTRVAQQFAQGNLEFTANNLDLAINGEGFFVLHDDAGNVTVSRAGAYGVDRNGVVVNHSNERLQVFPPVDTVGERFNTGTTTDLVLPTLSGKPKPTGLIDAALNLSASEQQPGTPFPVQPAVADETNVTTEVYNHATSTTIYDSLGTGHRATMYYRRSANPGEWQVYTYIDGKLAPGPAGDFVTMNFDANGALAAGQGDINAQGRVTLSPWEDDGNNDGNLSNGAAAIELTFDYNNSSQFGGSFAVNNLTQDGYTAGRLSGVEIDNEGIVFARFTNGQSSALGKVALARFNNNQGLRQLGDTSWAETFTSGDMQLGEAGTSSFGLLQSGALENSNVDIAEQLVNLITAQRNYQANAQVIPTADTITQTIINIR
ncbi:MAG TPA: flagellar hook protein FlgE [Sedimenticola sp.]|nr:flagellar hook protein FlgE [Sedimenticola sp.]